MSVGLEGNMALRCLSCEYDIASLVELRGSDEPGVCPECGHDLRDCLPSLNLPGLHIQHRWSFRGHVAWTCSAIFEPLNLIARASLPHAGNVWKANCRAAAVLCMSLMAIATFFGSITRYSSGFDLDTFVLLMLVGLGAVAAHFVGAVMISAATLAVLRLFEDARMGHAPWRSRLATDVASSWLIPWSAIIPVVMLVYMCVDKIAGTYAWQDPRGYLWTAIVLLVVVPLVASFVAVFVFRRVGEEAE
ncbi:MAG: hypothetical protein KF684_02455 [Phycisphaeraceae bacterium]|nr:hypothetical protein [Phycisphaeraceae bacterium]